jgi:hypothetical protein
MKDGDDLFGWVMFAFIGTLLVGWCAFGACETHHERERIRRVMKRLAIAREEFRP